ncbi:MAG: cellulase family glycosylhydrolase [Oscillochloris sp.]|nr:cellulase family glycosylhydrolase [Oscillochloris sp.]
MAHRQRGVILTYVDTLDTLEDAVRLGHYDAVKVVTGWGLATGWNDESRKRVLSMLPNVIVRTVSGDPSYARPFDPLAGKPRPGAVGPNAQYWEYDFPDPKRCEEEIAPWYAIKPDIMIEIGNEPNVYNQDDDFIWRWSYFLEQTIKHLRVVFPNAKLISPGFMMDPSGKMARFYEIAQQQIRLCDYIGMHFYEYYAFKPDQAPATKGELRDAVQLHQQYFADKPWYITEYGIHNTDQVSKGEKGARYARLIHGSDGWPTLPANVVGAVYYHLQMKGDIHPEYHIYPEGDKSYCAAYEAVGAVLGGAEILGGGIAEMLEPVKRGPLDETALTIARTISTLADVERDLVQRRLAAFGDGSAEFSKDDAGLLRRIQHTRKALEKALDVARDEDD